jgi:hypothetical protein
MTLSVASAVLIGACFPSPGETVDTSHLPPPSNKKIDFATDIQPLLQRGCLKCHSDEKPRSHFRLTSRAAALEGGEHGVDIVPGKSDQSSLIHYVARLVPDLEMPPEGRGTPLTDDEIGLLRAWIDQGVVWTGATNASSSAATVSPTVGWTGVSGDEKKFRELYWQREGWNGGLEEFQIIEKPTPDSTITSAGHVLRDDYKITLELQKNDLGFAHFGWSQFRKYYDDTGGTYPPLTPSTFSLNQDLHVDDGRAWAEFGLTLPRWPEIQIGYEHQYRNGTEATLQWGSVNDGTSSVKIYPAFKDLSEKTEILKFNLNYDIGGFTLSDNFRGEWYRLYSQEVNDSGYILGSGMALTTATEHQKYFQGANTFHLEKQFTDWLLGSGGYLYSKLNSDGSLDVTTLNPQFLDPALPFVPRYESDPIQLERESHVFSLSALLGPWQGLSLYLGTQNEWTRQTGLATAQVWRTLPFGIYFFSAPDQNLHSDSDLSSFSEAVGLRFTKIPFTALFAEARLQQESIGLTEEEDGGLTPFLRNTDSTSDLKDFRAGFNTSPWRRISLSGQFRRYTDQTYYDNLFKEVPRGEGYPAFISQRGIFSNEAEAKLAVQVSPWLKTTLGYQWLDNDYRTTTDPVSDPASGPGGFSPGGGILAGTYNAQTPSLNATFTPWRRLFLSTTFSYQHARTVTAANNSPSVAPYVGDIYSLMASGNYALNEKTDLTASYAFSTADFTQQDLAQGLPLGIRYFQHTLMAGVRRQISKTKTVALQYRFYLYDEPSSGGANNFDAHAIFATLTCRF